MEPKVTAALEWGCEGPQCSVSVLAEVFVHVLLEARDIVFYLYPESRLGLAHTGHPINTEE